jgi:cyclophilin family peptidyl-prolyl cis-trans isomerase
MIDYFPRRFIRTSKWRPLRVETAAKGRILAAFPYLFLASISVRENNRNSASGAHSPATQFALPSISMTKKLKTRKSPLRCPESLEARWLFAGQLPGLGDATRQHLSIYINGNEQVIPANIGVFQDHVELVQTKFANGVIRVAPAETPVIETELPTLGDFFETWRTKGGLAGNRADAFFDSTRIFGHTVDAGHTLRLFVNGVPSTEFENHRLGFNEDLLIVYDAIANTPPQLASIPNVSALGGAPLVIGLDGFDGDFDTLYYDVHSSNPQLQASLLEGRSLRMSVQGFGDMVFQLFDKLAPRAAGRIAELAQSGFHNDITFHRVINNFMIQGGDPTGTGSGGSDLGDFDDEFVADLQHTSPGLLSMAKTTDDTNDSQFFVTEVTTRHLDFNHSIFGKLIERDDVRQAISNVPTGTNDRPLTPVRIEATTVFQDSANRSLLLKASEGITGSSTVTVSVSDGRSVKQRSFVVQFQPDLTGGSNDSTPFLAPLPATVYVVDDQPLALPLFATDVENSPIQFVAVANTNLTTTLATTPITPIGHVAETPLTIQRKPGFTGTTQLTLRAQPVGNVTSDSRRDVQVINVQVITGALPGDANGDNQVGVADMQIVRAAFGFEGPDNPADVNDDGRVNLADLRIVRNAFGLARETPPPPATPTATSLRAMSADSVHDAASDAVFQAYPFEPAVLVDARPSDGRAKRTTRISAR